MAQRLWEQGQQQAAIDRLLERINAARPAIPRRLGLQLVYYIFQLGDLPGAELFLRQLLQVHPEDLEILENLAAVLSRQKKATEAVSILEQVVARSPGSANAWDGLAASLARLERFAEARAAGERSLALKTEAGRPLPSWQPPAGSPQQHLERPGRQQRRDVIAFSIWGSNPRYLRGALRNALLIPDLYPGWQARFHLDTTVPLEFKELLQSLGAEVQLMPAGQSMRQKLCWRFQVANDPAVGRFLVRDCDSVVNQREVAAVQQWLASECWFHVMRDWWSHTDPILAGMWGGIAGVLPDLTALLSAYKPPAKETAKWTSGSCAMCCGAASSPWPWCTTAITTAREVCPGPTPNRLASGTSARTNLGLSAPSKPPGCAPGSAAPPACSWQMRSTSPQDQHHNTSPAKNSFSRSGRGHCRRRHPRFLQV